MGTWLLPDDIRWRTMLAGLKHDVYHLPCYTEVVAENDGGTPRAYHEYLDGGELLIPLVQKKVPSQHDAYPDYDAASPYGYASPLCHDGISAAELNRAFMGFKEAGSHAGLVTTFVRLHPLLSQHLSKALSGNGDINVKTRGVTVSIDLTQGEKSLDQKLKTNHKRDIRKLCSAGFGACLDDWSDYPAFRRIYSRTMKRVSAAEYYYFSEAYFHRLRDCLGEVLHLCTVKNKRGEVVSGGLFTKVGRIVEYHLGATDDGCDGMAPSKLMFYFMRKWAVAENAEVFHLGGGVGGRLDSLYEFKKGFATNVHSYQTLSIIHDEPLYRRLSLQWQGVTRESIDWRDGYFPIYRRGATQFTN